MKEWSESEKAISSAGLKTGSLQSSKLKENVNTERNVEGNEPMQHILLLKPCLETAREREKKKHT